MNENAAEPVVAHLFPDLDFSAQVRDGFKGTFVSCRSLWNGTPGNDAVLDGTLLGKVGWATLFAYMHRRFGPPHLTGNPINELSAAWVLDTPDADVFVKVSPSLANQAASLVPLLCIPENGNGADFLSRCSGERIEAVRAAYRVTLLDLLRPVNVGMDSINALGVLGGEGNDLPELLAWREGDGKLVYEARCHPGSAIGIPIGFFDNQDWPILCKLIANMGKSDIVRGRAALMDMLRETAINEAAAAEWPIQRLLLLGCETDLSRLLAHLGLGDATRMRLFDDMEEIRRRSGMEARILGEMNPANVDVAAGILERLGYESGPLRERMLKLGYRTRSNRVRDAFTAVPGGPFPDEALPSRDMETAPELAEWLRKAVVRAGRPEFVSWIDDTIQMEDGRLILSHVIGARCLMAEKMAARGQAAG